MRTPNTVAGRVLAGVLALVLIVGIYFFAVRDDDRDQDRDRPLPARGQHLRGQRRADPRRQRRPGHRRRPRGQLGAGRHGRTTRSTTCPPTPRPSSSRRRSSPTGSSSSPRRTTKGDKVMADGADIALPDTGVPVELDRIYASLRDLSEALGPNGVNKDGTLDHVLQAGAKALDGKGELGNQMLTQLAAAAQTFGEGSGPLFDTVTQLAPVHHDAGARTTSSSAPSSRTWPASPRSWPASAPRSGSPWPRSPTRSAPSRGSSTTTAGAGHRRREADPGDADDQLREGQPRHRAQGRADGDRQPRAWPSTPRPGRSARGSASAATSGTPTASSARWCSRPACPARPPTSPARSSSSCSSRSRASCPTIPPATPRAAAGNATAATGRSRTARCRT